MIRKIFSIVCVLGALTARNCGSNTILGPETVLDQTDFVKATVDLGEPQNGQKLTLLGYFQLDDEEQRVHPLLRVRVVQQADEQEEPTLRELIAMDYNNTADQGKVGVIVANGETEFLQEEIDANIPIGEYFHWAVSLDYEKGFATFAFFGKDLNASRTLTVNFPEFQLRE